jgi:AcrR family transcriptional regulator
MTTTTKKRAGFRLKKKQATRELIKQEAARLFREHGFENVTIVQIAEAANVDVTTFWRHYRSKLAVLHDDHNEWSDHFLDALKNIPAERSPVAAILDALMIAPPVGAGQLSEIRTQLMGSPSGPSAEMNTAMLTLEEAMREAILRGLSMRLGRDDPNDPTALILASTIVAALSWYVAKAFQEQNPNRERARETLERVLLTSFMSAIHPDLLKG